MRQSFGLGFVAVVVALLGCSNGGGRPPGASSNHSSSEGGERGVPNSAVHKSGSGSVTATLGPPGGSLELASGPKVEIPAGAIDGSQDFVLREAPMTTAFFNEEHERPVGPTFILSPGVDAPDGGTVRVSIPLASYPQGERARFIRPDEVAELVCYLAGEKAAPITGALLSIDFGSSAGYTYQ